MLQTTPPELPPPTDPVEQPIINSPFHPPEYHWPLNSDTKAFAPVASGRRTSQNIPPVAGSKGTKQGVAQLGDIGVGWEELHLVNQVREEVSGWQDVGCPGITPTSRELIDHWTNPEACQLYFAQLDAVLTHIYLHEVAPPEIREKLHEINRKYNEGIHRMAHKMATATGKTPVMAMLILYHAANQNADPDDQRFVRRFLVITPGLTVKERLQDSLNPGHEDNDWTAFSLAPPGDRWERALTSASINIINYHQMEPKQVISIGSKQQDLIDGGSTPTTEAEMETRIETTADVIERIADGKSQRGHIVVINDEGHHCHRGDPDAPKAQKETEWFDGIRRIQDQNLLRYVTDMSATPIFLAQSSPRPFEWIVSDYSLVDAIEAGLTKIPRVPTHTSLKDEAEFRDIFGSTDSKQTANFQPETTETTHTQTSPEGPLRRLAVNSERRSSMTGVAMISAIPRPDEVYRFRSIDALIGSHKELYRQTIYLAKPEQLNDPAEDTVNVVWHGDEILWPNLITYYWRSFVASLITRSVFLPGHHALLPDYQPLERSQLSPVVENEALRLRERYSTQRAEVLAELSQRKSPVPQFDLRSLLSKLTPPEHYRLSQLAGLPPLDDFPNRFVQAMGKILLSKWRVAGFTNDFTNPFLWSVYAEDHAGICLVFDRESLRNLRPPEDCESVELEEVSYQLKKPEIEFFANVPSLTVSEYKKLFTDESGMPSPNYPHLLEDKDNIRKAVERQNDFNRSNLLTKQKYWEAEKEVRMFSRLNLIWSGKDDPAMYTIQYPIDALKGVIFGSRTSQEHKQAILDIVLAKHYVSPMREDFWFTEAYSQPDGSIKKKPYSPYVDWQHTFVYPKTGR